MRWCPAWWHSKHIQVNSNGQSQGWQKMRWIDGNGFMLWKSTSYSLHRQPYPGFSWPNQNNGEDALGICFCRRRWCFVDVPQFQGGIFAQTIRDQNAYEFYGLLTWDAFFVAQDPGIWIDADMAEVAIQIESENQKSKRCSSLSEMSSDALIKPWPPHN